MFERSASRKGNRHPNWDYSRPAWYLLTIVTADRKCILGRVENSEVVLSPLGAIVRDELLKSIEMRAELTLDCFVIMPNHIHIVLVIAGQDRGEIGYSREPGEVESKSASSFVAGFKSGATTAINTLRKSPGARVWHRSFHDHIIRTEESLFAIRQYVLDNPRKWELDRMNPVDRPEAADELECIIDRDSPRLLPI